MQFHLKAMHLQQQSTTVQLRVDNQLHNYTDPVKTLSDAVDNRNVNRSFCKDMMFLQQRRTQVYQHWI